MGYQIHGSWPTLAKTDFGQTDVGQSDFSAKPTMAKPTLAKPSLTCGVGCGVFVCLCVCVFVCLCVCVLCGVGVRFTVSWCGVSRVGVGFKVLVWSCSVPPGPPFPGPPFPRDRPSPGTALPVTALPGTALPPGPPFPRDRPSPGTALPQERFAHVHHVKCDLDQNSSTAVRHHMSVNLCVRSVAVPRCSLPQLRRFV